MCSSINYISDILNWLYPSYEAMAICLPHMERFYKYLLEKPAYSLQFKFYCIFSLYRHKVYKNSVYKIQLFTSFVFCPVQISHKALCVSYILHTSLKFAIFTHLIIYCNIIDSVGKSSRNVSRNSDCVTDVRLCVRVVWTLTQLSVGMPSAVRWRHPSVLQFWPHQTCAHHDRHDCDLDD